MAPNSSSIPLPYALAMPLRPTLAFRVGVVGHRPNRLEQARLNELTKVVQVILQVVRDAVVQCPGAIRELYEPGQPMLRAVSPLAEGTDRIFARAALETGFALSCVMPFPQAEFEKDFAPGLEEEKDSLAAFRDLVDKATTRFELDGSRSDEGTAYGSAGQVVLNQSDLLIVLWDGERQGRRGGTEETMDVARSRGVPMVWIDARAPHRWQLVEVPKTLTAANLDGRCAPDGTGTTEALGQLVHEALDLPHLPADPGSPHSKRTVDDPHQNYRRFLAERQPWRKWGLIWKVFRDVMADSRWPTVTNGVEPFEAAVKREWPVDPRQPLERVIGALRPYYAWPDKLAVHYADRYRSAFILGFLLAAGAVAMALLPLGCCFVEHGWAETACTAIELGVIVTILSLVLIGRRRHWHERWIDYRLGAELIRHLRIVAPLGGERPFSQAPAHHATYGLPGATWMDWYARAASRVVGLPNAVVDEAHVAACLLHVEQLVAGQITYHETNARRCNSIEHRLHTLGVILFGLALGACVLHLLHIVLPSPLLTFLCGFFPALGAALAGIGNQGEFRRMSKRSMAMQEQLKPLLGKAKALRAHLQPLGAPPSRKAANLASDVALLLVKEVLDWRVVILDRPLHLAV